MVVTLLPDLRVCFLNSGGAGGGGGAALRIRGLDRRQSHPRGLAFRGRRRERCMEQSTARRKAPGPVFGGDVLPTCPGAQTRCGSTALRAVPVGHCAQSGREATGHCAQSGHEAAVCRAVSYRELPEGAFLSLENISVHLQQLIFFLKAVETFLKSVIT